jgi:hypothetical protein
MQEATIKPKHLKLKARKIQIGNCEVPFFRFREKQLHCSSAPLAEAELKDKSRNLVFCV